MFCAIKVYKHHSALCLKVKERQADLQMNFSFGRLPNVGICLNCLESHYNCFLKQKSWFDETEKKIVY